jgi:hypothetical protein
MRERERQVVSEWPSLEELVKRSNNGWHLVSLEWEREAKTRTAPVVQAPVEIPYGLRVSDDGFHLEDEPAERRVLMVLLDSIVDDRPLSHAAADLNRLGYTTREGTEWTPPAVFNLLPRLIEAGPKIFASSDWVEQRERRRTA